MTNILLVRPAFPDSRNNVYSIPIGLCKIASWKKSEGYEVIFINGTDMNIYEEVEEIYITSVFTYWSSITIDTINYYKQRYPTAKIICGGIYASISPTHLKNSAPVDEIVIGTHPIAEHYSPDYSILDIINDKVNDSQIIWTGRGCKRYCDHCYVHIIEPDLIYYSVESIKNEMLRYPDKKKVYIYDNSLLQHPEIKSILEMFVELHKRYKYTFTCTQGIDGRMLQKLEESEVPVSLLMKKAGFNELRFSYDWEFQKESVYYCINSFESVKYRRNDMQVFVIINSKETPKVIEKRYWEIYQLGCQIHSDRFRPGNWFYDNYNGSKKQADIDYFISTEFGWTDTNIKGTLRLMADLNYATRLGCLYIEVKDMQKSKELNKGKSSVKLTEYLDSEDLP